jgi:competence protein ComEC
MTGQSAGARWRQLRVPLMAGSALLPLTLAGPPPLALMCCAALAALACALDRRWRFICWLLLPALLTLGTIHLRLADRLGPEWLDRASRGAELNVVGTVAGLPERRDDVLEFLFAPQQPAGLPRLLRVRWYRDAPALIAGEQWRLPLRLKPPVGRVNFSGPDDERRWFAAGVGGLATVSGASARRLSDGSRWRPDRIRQALRTALVEQLEHEPALGFILALAIADRSFLSAEHWRVLSLTGTGHLLAISGLHVGFAALMGFRAGWLGTALLPHGWRLAAGLAPAWWVAWFAATAYAALAGFSVSTRRALIMLGVLMLARLTRRAPGLLRAWWLALLVVLLLDPLSPLTPGFWLSFGAVAALLLHFGPRVGQPGRFGRLALAQLSIMLIMLPLGMYWFQRASALGLMANLLAIPWVSLVIVPLVLAGLGLCVIGWPGAGFALLRPAAWGADGLSRFLAWLAAHGASWSTDTHQPALATSLLACAGLLLWLGPRGLRGRALALLLAVPALLPRAVGLPAGAAQLELLDVGQGLAATLGSAGHLALYDSGPGQPGRWNLVNPVVAPAIRASGHGEPDRVIVSHGDLDHAGGLDALRAQYPDSRYLVSTREAVPGTAPCNDRLSWAVDGLRFRVLHPSPWLPYLGNLSSCVLSVRSAHHSILFPGDIDRVVEQRLVGAGLPPHQVLVAPHHGSDTSSGEALVRAVRPRLVLIAAGAGNRFGFPHAGVVERYRRAGAQVFSVSDCGALRVRLAAGVPPGIRSARRHRPGPWRWPPGAHCP